MQVSELRNFGVAFSDSESLWPDEVKRRMRKQGNAVIMASLGPLQKIRFGLAFFAARRKARKGPPIAARRYSAQDDGNLRYYRRIGIAIGCAGCCEV